MSALGDVFTALKSVVLIQERLDQTRDDLSNISRDLLKLKDFTHQLDKRLYAVETVIELGARQSQQKRIEE